MDGGEYGGVAPDGRTVDSAAEWRRDGVPRTFSAILLLGAVTRVLWAQDLGNTNFSIHLPRTSFDRHATAQVVLRAVRALGVEAHVNDRNDVCVGEYKISRVPASSCAAASVAWD